MNIFKKIGEHLGFIEPNKTEEIMQKRSQIKQDMEEKLKTIGFNEDEINEVLSILTECEKEVQKQKDMLIGTNINNPQVDITMKEIFGEIRRIELKSVEKMKEKIKEIKTRKGI